MRKFICFFLGHNLEPQERAYLIQNTEPPIADYSGCPEDAQPNLLVTFYYISSLWNEYVRCKRCGRTSTNLMTERSKIQYYQMSFLREGRLHTILPRLIRKTGG